MRPETVLCDAVCSRPLWQRRAAESRLNSGCHIPHSVSASLTLNTMPADDGSPQGCFARITFLHLSFEVRYVGGCSDQTDRVDHCRRPFIATAPPPSPSCGFWGRVVRGFRNTYIRFRVLGFRVLGDTMLPWYGRQKFTKEPCGIVIVKTIFEGLILATCARRGACGRQSDRIPKLNTPSPVKV